MEGKIEDMAGIYYLSTLNKQVIQRAWTTHVMNSVHPFSIHGHFKHLFLEESKHLTIYSSQ